MKYHHHDHKERARGSPDSQSIPLQIEEVEYFGAGVTNEKILDQIKNTPLCNKQSNLPFKFLLREYKNPTHWWTWKESRWRQSPGWNERSTQWTIQEKLGEGLGGKKKG